MAKDYYKILGVGRDATAEEIKKAFRRVARETHPDTNPGDERAESLFREAAEAYEVLSDPVQRRRFDRGDTVDLSDIFGGIGSLDDLLQSVFGQGGFFGNSTRSSRGRDVLIRAEISLEEAAFGTESHLEYRTTIACSICGGTGAEPGTKAETCPDCRGVGQVRVSRGSFFGSMMSITSCPTCHGEGSTLTDPCDKCGGTGSTPDVVNASVEIPAGVTTGTRLRLSGRGEFAGRVGPPGDLYVEILVADDPRFERQDSNLIYRAQVGLAEATLGTRLEVPLIEGGTVEVEIEGGTQPGSTYRLDGRGMTVLGRRTRGSLIVVVDVIVPTALTQEEDELLRRWADLRGERIDRPAST